MSGSTERANDAKMRALCTAKIAEIVAGGEH